MIRVATRKSTLAQVQADKIIELIKEKLNVEAKKVLYTTKGDRILDKTLDKVGGKGLFVKDIEVALLKGEADCAVHSMKDVPFDLNDEFEIVATPVREDARDAFVSISGQSFFELRKGARVGTSSRRRAMQLLSLRSDLEIVPIRGNVETRIRKIEEEELDGIVLAAAGLKRLNLEAIITDYFDVENFIPASNQGILGVEVLKKSLYKEHLKKIDDEEVHFCCMVEKYVMKLLNGGCHSASCAYAKLDRDRIYIIAANEVSGVLKKGSIEGNKEDYINLCKKLVERIV
ncbi:MULTISPECIES: hydroxymethylbilane synthase [Caloramator]|uniref:Hydroxymethylbilane synthase n=1 Tax=Caloramator proteoclasticus DSM 10124 TaxID=1121262 RepID=A0A1M4S9H0_9CLOT|nr:MULTISPECIES: hydroxymethylbilane synthase [Caloramator]SHE28841.1 hydroxymethylbilane synthase [Caloramator proteoclasticus DSM 10124]